MLFRKIAGKTRVLHKYPKNSDDNFNETHSSTEQNSINILPTIIIHILKSVCRPFKPLSKVFYSSVDFFAYSYDCFENTLRIFIILRKREKGVEKPESGFLYSYIFIWSPFRSIPSFVFIRSVVRFTELNRSNNFPFKFVNLMAGPFAIFMHIYFSMLIRYICISIDRTVYIHSIAHPAFSTVFFEEEEKTLVWHCDRYIFAQFYGTIFFCSINFTQRKQTVESLFDHLRRKKIHKPIHAIWTNAIKKSVYTLNDCQSIFRINKSHSFLNRLKFSYSVEIHSISMRCCCCCCFVGLIHKSSRFNWKWIAQCEKRRTKERKKLFNLSHSLILFWCCNFDCICHRLLYQSRPIGRPMFFFVFFSLFFARLILKLTQNSHLFCKWISSNIQEKYYYWVVYFYFETIPTTNNGKRPSSIHYKWFIHMIMYCST